MGLVESLAFPVPRRDLGELRLRGAGAQLVSTRSGACIPLVVEAPSAGAGSSPFCIIYSHGNAEDLSLVLPFVKQVCKSTGCTVIAYDYIGYSISEPRDRGPSERGCYEAIDAALAFAASEGGGRFPPEQVVLYGRSLGSGPTIDLSSRLGDRLAGTILMSPLSSAVRTQLGEFSSRLLSQMDIFKSIHKVGRIKCPTLIMHGEADGVVPCSNGRALWDRLPPEAKNGIEPWWCKARGHNDMPEGETLEHVAHFMGMLSERTVRGIVKEK